MFFFFQSLPWDRPLLLATCEDITDLYSRAWLGPASNGLTVALLALFPRKSKLTTLGWVQNSWEWGRVPPTGFIWSLAPRYCVIGRHISIVWVPVVYRHLLDTVMIPSHSVTNLPWVFILEIRTVSTWLGGNTGIVRYDPFHRSWNLKDKNKKFFFKAW